MSRISILPELLINKIAAGEVIERPASIVRELIDNSIDAGARIISVDVLHGGKKLIRITDDGTGIHRDDASLCFERHATSKIKTEDDLFNITTLGFRGEALASIASVSKVTLVTSTADSQIGTKMEITTSHKKEISDAPPVNGTILEIRDIFYNTPARRKFLKSIPTELSHIIETVMQKALSYPGISFSLKHNDSEVINVSATKSLKERFIQLYSEELFNEFLEIEKHGTGIKLYGFSSVAEFARSTKNYQYIFINRRPVKNPTVSHAVYNAYRELLPRDKHPAFFLFLDINPEKVDVNVHPAKREVRFESPEDIHKFVEFTVKEAINSRQYKTQTSELPSYTSINNGNQVIRETLESALQPPGDLQTDFFNGRIPPSIQRYSHIGESFVAEITDNGITIIDQHAAHERVLYEKFLRKISLEIENLFLPIRMELPVREFNIIMNYKKLLHDFGFDVEEFGINNVIIRTIPKELRKADIKGILMDTASGIIEEETTGIKDESGRQNLLQNIASRLACHKSVRGREPLNNEELSQLVADLEKTEMPDRCPHGRPTRIFFSLDDLRKMFKRK